MSSIETSKTLNSNKVALNTQNSSDFLQNDPENPENDKKIP